MRIYQRCYDNPMNENGTMKPNKFLGSFKILETLEEDTYSSLRIGETKGKIYLIRENEVSGRIGGYGGSVFSVLELATLQKRK